MGAEELLIKKKEEKRRKKAASGKSDRTEVRANIFSSSCWAGTGGEYRAAIPTSTHQIECVSVVQHTVISFDIQFVHPARVHRVLHGSIYPAPVIFAFIIPRQKSSP